MTPLEPFQLGAIAALEAFREQMLEQRADIEGPQADGATVFEVVYALAGDVAAAIRHGRPLG